MSYYESEDIEKEMAIKLRKADQKNIGRIIDNIKQRITQQLKNTISIEDNLSHIIIIKNFIDSLKSEISAKKHLKLNLIKVISNGAVNELNSALNYLHLKDDFLNEQFELTKQKEMNINIKEKVIKGIMNNKIKNINNISSKQYFYPKGKKTPFAKANLKHNQIQFDSNYQLCLLLEKVITHNKLIKQYLKEDKTLYHKRKKIKVMYRKTKSAKDISKCPSKQYLLTLIDSKSSKEGYSYMRRYSDGVRDLEKHKGRTVGYDEEMKYEQVNSTIISKNDMKDVDNIKKGIKNKIKATIRSIYNNNNLNKEDSCSNINNNNSSVSETPVYTNANISFGGTFGQMKVRIVNTPVCSRPNEDLRESYSTGQLHLQELKDKINEISKCNNNNNNNNNLIIEHNNNNNEFIPKLNSTNDVNTNTSFNDKRKSEINLIKGRRKYINGNSFINVFNRSNSSIQPNETVNNKIFLRQNKSLRSNKKTEELNSFLDSLLLSTKKTLEHDNYSQEALGTHSSIQVNRFSLTKEQDNNNNIQNDICDSPYARFLKSNIIQETEIESNNNNMNNSNNNFILGSDFHIRTRNAFTNKRNENKAYILNLNSDDNVNMLSNKKLFQSPTSNTYHMKGRKNILAELLLNEDDLVKEDNCYCIELNNSKNEINDNNNNNVKAMMPITENVNVSSSYEDDKREHDESRNNLIKSMEKKDSEKSQCLFFENGIPSQKKQLDDLMSSNGSSSSEEKSYPILISPLKKSTRINFSQLSIDKDKNDISNNSSSIIIHNLQSMNQSAKNSLNYSSSKEINNKYNHINTEQYKKMFNTEQLNESKYKTNNNNNKQYLTEIKHNNNNHHHCNIFSVNNNNTNEMNSSFIQDKFKQIQDKYKINTSYNKDKKHLRHLSKFSNDNLLLNNSLKHSLIHLTQELNFEDNNENNNEIPKNVNKNYLTNATKSKHEYENNFHLETECFREYYSCSHNIQDKAYLKDNKHYLQSKTKNKQNIIDLDLKEEQNNYQKKNITIYLDCSSESSNEDNVNQDIITPQSIPLGVDCCYSQRKNNYKDNINQDIMTPQSIPLEIVFNSKRNNSIDNNNNNHNNNNNESNYDNQGLLTPQSIPIGIDYIPIENNNNNINNSNNNNTSEILTPQSIPLGINYYYNNNNKHESNNNNNISDDEVLLIYSVDKTIKSSNNSNCLYNGKDDKEKESTDVNEPEKLSPNIINTYELLNINNNNKEINSSNERLFNIENNEHKSNNNETQNNINDILNSKSSLNYILSLTSSSLLSEDNHQKQMLLLSKDITNNNNEYTSTTNNDQDNIYINEIKEQLTRNRINNNYDNTIITNTKKEIHFNNNNNNNNKTEFANDFNNNNNNNNNNVIISHINKTTSNSFFYNKQPLISIPIDNQDKTVTKESEIPYSPQEPFFHKTQLNSSAFINQYNPNSELALIEIPSSKNQSQLPSLTQITNIPKETHSISTDFPLNYNYTYIHNNTFSVHSQNNNNNNNNCSGCVNKHFESRKTTFHPSKRPYLYPTSLTSSSCEEHCLCITQPPRKTISAIFTSCNNTSFKNNHINKFDFFGIFNANNTQTKPLSPQNKKHNFKDTIIKENIKQGIKYISNKLFKKHIFNIIKNLPLKPSNI